MNETYWDSITTPYQMGEQKHRLYLLNLLEEHKVKSILDVGCGTGPIYQLIQQKGYKFEYKGVDFCKGMVQTAKIVFPEGNFEVQDMRNLKEMNNSWECVLLLHTLDHVDNYQKALAEATRVSAKYICIVLWKPFVFEGDYIHDRSMYGKQIGEEPWKDTYLHVYSKEALEKEFKKNHLDIVHVAEGEQLNSELSRYNFLYLLEKV
jgi:ubiquinone/menaquinone biosynthesis C-methylase UbiE